jgi:hypothetical protein
VNVRWRRGNELGVQFIRKANQYQQASMLRQQQSKWQEWTVSQAQNSNRSANSPGASTFSQQHQRVKTAGFLQTLGLDPNLSFTAAQLKRAYKLKALSAHPDRGGDTEKFQQVSAAYDHLLDHITG